MQGIPYSLHLSFCTPYKILQITFYCSAQMECKIEYARTNEFPVLLRKPAGMQYLGTFSLRKQPNTHCEIPTDWINAP